MSEEYFCTVCHGQLDTDDLNKCAKCGGWFCWGDCGGWEDQEDTCNNCSKRDGL